jgi:hypothetical protein
MKTARRRLNPATAALAAAVAGLLTALPASAVAAAPESISEQAAGAVVAIVDTGVDGAALPAAPAQEWACDAAGCAPETGAGHNGTAHGTSVAAVLERLAPGTAYASYRITTRYGLVSVPALRSAVAAAADAGIRVVNMSAVTFDTDPAIARTIRTHPGTLFITAAGNQGRRVDAQHPVTPCIVNAPNVLCVAAATDTGDLWAGSNRSARHVALAAPGVRVPTYDGPFGPRTATGTSVAAPAVSAAAARIWTGTSCRSATQVADAITATVRRTTGLDGHVRTGGILDADAALAHAQEHCIRASSTEANAVPQLAASGPQALEEGTAQTPVVSAE